MQVSTQLLLELLRFQKSLAGSAEVTGCGSGYLESRAGNDSTEEVPVLAFSEDAKVPFKDQ